VGVSLALVSAGALLVSTFLQTAAVETGLVPEGVLTFRVTAASERYGSRDALLDFLDQLEQRIDGLPGVRSAGLSGFLPLAPGIWSDNFARVGTSDAPPDLPAARMQFITPALTAALGIDLVAGRGFAVTDRAGAPPVALVSEGLATRYFDGAAVGREIDWQGGRRRIVGVLADTLQDGLHEPPEPTLYLPLAQYPRASVWVVARTGAEPLALLPAARDALRAIDPFVLAATPGTLEARIDEAMAPERFRAGLASAIGVVAAALAALGLYGVLAQSVAMRRSEIGIRMALGASATGVRRSIIRRALGLTGAGLGLGVVLSASTSRLLQGFLVPGVAPLDAGVLAAVAVVLSLLAVAAAWLPARQASRVDPLHVLRAD
jgi:predicted permease